MSFSLADQYFIGRGTQLALLKKRCLALKDGFRQNIAILGPRFIGKTVLWQQLTQLLDDEKIAFVYLDCDGRSLQELSQGLIRNLCWRVASKKQVAADDDTRLMHEALIVMPQTAALMQAIGNLIKESKQREAFHAYQKCSPKKQVKKWF
jgi:ABC-type phosphate/phosphonate transport system ATPase subunit